MKVMNNGSAMLALGELKKNQSSMEKQLKKVASGMKINHAGDGASEYSISEKMQVRIRCLNQNDENVKTGMNLLHVAEGGVQSQLNILRTIKEKVIDASNDTNTDIDRATIQKEIDQGYAQMEAITQETDYNRRRLLVGGTYYETVFSWDKLDSAALVEDSDSMNMIPDTYQTLDGVEGPFDIFSEYTTKASSIDKLGLAASQNFSGAADGSPAKYEMSFANYSSVSELDGVGFNIGGRNYVLTTDPAKKYNLSNSSSIDISGCLTVGDVVSKIASNGITGFTAEASGQILKLTTTLKDSSANNYTITGVSASETEVSESETDPVPERPAVSGTGKFTTQTYLTGGKNPVGTQSSDPDAHYEPGVQASLIASGFSADTGFTLNGSGYPTNKVYIKFVSGNAGFSADNSLGDKNSSGSISAGYYTVGVDGNSTLNIAGMTLTYSGGTLTITSNTASTLGNNYYAVDGIPRREGKDSETVPAYTKYAVTAFSGTSSRTEDGTDGTPATYTISLADIPATTSTDDLEAVISDLSGKGISVYDSANRRLNKYGFIDSANTMSLSSTNQYGGTTIDLNSLRASVESGTNIKEALQSLLLVNLGQATADGDDVLLTTAGKGTAANNSTVTVEETKYGSYAIDYAAWFSSNPDAVIPNDLYDKGFRWYCATDKAQWFNIVFTDGSPLEEGKPASGTAAEDIQSISVDVSEVQSAADLVKAIYEQANPVLQQINHHYLVAADTYKGVLTVYDQRKNNLRDTATYPDRQEKGAKIADGVFDNVVKSERDIYVEDIVIQHTDHSNMNIHVKIPRMTFDHIFGYKPGVDDIKNYTVLEKKARELLLGIPPDEGLLDKGINYILDAATLIGAQNRRLEHTNDNITVVKEKTIAAESIIRDADMAKEMAGYVRDNLLSQASKNMLAQANQNSSQVLSLLG